jgi:hypothetical protein
MELRALHWSTTLILRAPVCRWLSVLPWNVSVPKVPIFGLLLSLHVSHFQPKFVFWCWHLPRSCPDLWRSCCNKRVRNLSRKRDLLECYWISQEQTRKLKRSGLEDGWQLGEAVARPGVTPQDHLVRSPQGWHHCHWTRATAEWPEGTLTVLLLRVTYPGGRPHWGYHPCSGCLGEGPSSPQIHPVADSANRHGATRSLGFCWNWKLKEASSGNRGCIKSWGLLRDNQEMRFTLVSGIRFSLKSPYRLEEWLKQ